MSVLRKEMAETKFQSQQSQQGPDIYVGASGPVSNDEQAQVRMRVGVGVCVCVHWSAPQSKRLETGACPQKKRRKKKKKKDDLGSYFFGKILSDSL